MQQTWITMIRKVQQQLMQVQKSASADLSARLWNMLLTCQPNNDGCIFLVSLYT